jgi:hypothetical protein
MEFCSFTSSQTNEPMVNGVPSAIAVEYEGVGDLIRMYADAGDDAERLSIVIVIGELMADITRAHP